MILTAAQQKAFQKAIATANDVLPQLELLERVAQMYPPIQEQVAQARAQREMLVAVSEAALEANRVLSQ